MGLPEAGLHGRAFVAEWAKSPVIKDRTKRSLCTAVIEHAFKLVAEQAGHTSPQPVILRRIAEQIGHDFGENQNAWYTKVSSRNAYGILQNKLATLCRSKQSSSKPLLSANKSYMPEDRCPVPKRKMPTDKDLKLNKDPGSDMDMSLRFVYAETEPRAELLFHWNRSSEHRVCRLFRGNHLLQKYKAYRVSAMLPTLVSANFLHFINWH